MYTNAEEVNISAHIESRHSRRRGNERREGTHAAPRNEKPEGAELKTQKAASNFQGPTSSEARKMLAEPTPRSGVVVD